MHCHRNACHRNARFHYDGDALIGEYNASGTQLQRYIHGPGAGDDPLIRYPGSSTARNDAHYFYADRLGSIVQEVKRDGTVTAINSYDAYGIPGASSGINNQGRFRYTGQTWIAELGMYYYKARMYSPTLGRFMQTDPIGYADGMNIYAYVGNDPVNMVDPTGLFGLTCTNYIHDMYDVYRDNGDGTEDWIGRERGQVHTRTATCEGDIGSLLALPSGLDGQQPGSGGVIVVRAIRVTADQATSGDKAAALCSAVFVAIGLADGDTAIEKFINERGARKAYDRTQELPSSRKQRLRKSRGPRLDNILKGLGRVRGRIAKGLIGGLTGMGEDEFLGLCRAAGEALD